MAGKTRRRQHAADAAAETQRMRDAERDPLADEILTELAQSFRFGGRRMSDDQAEDMLLHQRDRALWRATREIDDPQYLPEYVLAHARLTEAIMRNLAAHHESVTRRTGSPDRVMQVVFGDGPGASSVDVYAAPATEAGSYTCDECGAEYRPRQELLGYVGTTQIPYYCPSCVRDAVRSRMVERSKKSSKAKDKAASKGNA